MLFHGRDFRDDQPYYEVAQVCLNGHVITDTYNSSLELRKNFCPKCGAQTIHECPHCGENIQGDYIVPGVVVAGRSRRAPAYCHNCGQAFPWTEARLEAARQLTLETEELGEEKESLAGSLPDLVSDTPRTPVAAKRWERALRKIGGHTADVFKEIFVEVASETAKKILFP
jgi:hypothetical protein